MIAICDADSPGQMDAVRALFAEYAESLDFKLCFQDFDRELAGLPGDYAPPSGRILMAEVNGAVAGCVALRALSETVCEMKRLYVRPAYRKLKIGRRLAAAIVEAGRDIGYRTMRLDTVPSMQAAIALYRSLGFREIAPYRRNPVPGALFMELDLARED